MIELQKRLNAFTKLGEVLASISENIDCSFLSPIQNAAEAFAKEAQHIYLKNPWYTREFVDRSIKGLVHMLQEEQLKQWVQSYPHLKEPVNKSKEVAIIMAGNIPLVGFHDFLAVLVSGHRVLVRQSSSDKHLLPALANLLTHIEPAFADYIKFTDQIIKGFDAIIATGSNNSSRYFEYYFGKYPNIIRKNRNSVAILDGKESESDLEALAEDIYLYFGLGCRNVSKIYIPKGYNMIELLKKFERFEHLKNHTQYFNNYEYNKSIFLVNQIPHYDTGFSLFKEDTALGSPLSVIHFEYYNEINDVIQVVNESRDKIQCVASNLDSKSIFVPFGKTQNPDLWDYADGVDTLDFLRQI